MKIYMPCYRFEKTIIRWKYHLSGSNNTLLTFVVSADLKEKLQEFSNEAMLKHG